jgi:hypothetical protein
MERMKLPKEIMDYIKDYAELRKRKGLFDDTEDRIERAIRYQEFLKKRDLSKPILEAVK